MVKKDVSPEEKLLSIIKSKNKNAAAAPALQAPKETPGVTIMSKADERLDGMLKSELFKTKLFEPSTLKNLKKTILRL